MMHSLHVFLRLVAAALVGCLLTAPAALAAGGEHTKLNLPSDTSAKAVQSSGGGNIVRTIVGLAVVLGVIYGLYWVLKQVKASKETGASGAGLESLATLPLGGNRALHLIRAGGEVVLIGTAEHGVTPIRRFSEEEARSMGLLDDEPVPATLATIQGEPTPAQPGVKGFLEALRARTVMK